MKPFGIDSINEAERLAIAKRALNNLLTSYADEADVFAEIIQNSFDAILQAYQNNLYSETVKPELTIVLGRRDTGHHYLFVKDNGLGMSKEVAENLTVPGFSHGKKRGKTIGYKGVGASYFFAASQCVSIKTVSQSDETTEYTVRGSFDWIKGEDEPEPIIEGEAFVPPFLKPLLPTTRGTSIYFQFHDGIKPKNLNNLVIIGQGENQEIQNWMCFLSVKTAIGLVERKPNFDLKINVHLDKGDKQFNQVWTLGEFDLLNKSIGYPFPQKVLAIGESKNTIDAAEIHLRYRHEKRHPAIYFRWTAEDIIKETQLDEAEVEILRQYLKWAEGYFCYSVDILKEINDTLGGRSRLLRHGIKIACDSIPQGRMIDLSLTSSQGLDRQTHIVLAFENLELDTGRKISADETIANSVTKIGNRIVSILKEYRWAMKKKNRPDVSSDLNSWRLSIEERAKTSLIKTFYEAHTITPVFEVDPSNEAEVIALFISLLAHKFLKGYTLQAISGFERYDALIKIDQSDNSHFDRNDVIAIRNKEKLLTGANKVLEFKYSFEDLIIDFDDKKKNPSELDIVVCWTVSDLNVSRGRIQPMYSKWKDYRSLYGGTYIWSDENDTSTIPIICLKNLLCELLRIKESATNNPGLGSAIITQIEKVDELSLL